MPTETTPDAVLNGILTCSQCNANMALRQDRNNDHNPYFTCGRQTGQTFTGCLTPDLDANRLDKLLFETIMQTVMSRKNVDMLIARTDQLLAMKPAEFQGCPTARENRGYSRKDLQAMTTNYSLMVQAAGGPHALRELLRKFIEDIRIRPGNAVVHYRKPLPSDSPATNRWIMNIPIPPDTMTCRLPVYG